MKIALIILALALGGCSSFGNLATKNDQLILTVPKELLEAPKPLLEV